MKPLLPLILIVTFISLFYGTPIPTCIMVFKKCKENPNDVLFINAAEHFERGTQNTLRQEDIDRIVTTY